MGTSVANRFHSRSCIGANKALIISELDLRSINSEIVMQIFRSCILIN